MNNNKKYLLIQKFSSLLYFVKKLLNDEKVNYDLPFTDKDITILRDSYDDKYIGVEINNNKTKITFKYIDNCNKIQVTTEEEPTFTNTITISYGDEYFNDIEYPLFDILHPKDPNEVNVYQKYGRFF